MNAAYLSQAKCRHRLLSREWFALLLLACLFAFAARPALSQPAVGSTVRGALALGWGASVPLPEGDWRVAATPVFNQPNMKYEVIVLHHLRDDAPIPLLVVRHIRDNRTSGWPALPCDAGPAREGSTEFMRTAHGSGSNDVVNRCSRAWPIGDFARWRASAVPPDRWWQELGADALAIQPSANLSGALLVQLSLQEHLKRRLYVEAFVRPPQGRTPAQFREAVVSGSGGVEAEMFSTWTAVYMASMQLSFLNLTPRPVIALGWATGPATATAANPVRPAAGQAAAGSAAPTAGSTPAAAKPSTGAAVAAAPAATPSTVAAAPSTAATTATSATSATTPALAATSAAIEQQNRDLQAQLDQMRKTLAQLQATVEKGAAQKAPAPQAEAPRPFVPRPPAPHRKALVIGNDRYLHVAPLANAAADAESMARTLQAVGFTVTRHVNLDEKQFKQALRDFRMRVQGGDEVIFFFAGHGVQLGAANYLLPTDIRADHEEQVKDEAIPLQRILDDLNDRKAKFALAVVDACRDNPFQSKGRSIGGRGLAPTSAATGQMVMYSAGAGQQALDRLGPNDQERNGLFTRVLLREMTVPGQSVDRVLRNVRNEVVKLARGVGHEQTPALYDQAIGEFFFSP
jgi:HPt (histidine-containing phosphotransfer) domain-containing protein